MTWNLLGCNIIGVTEDLRDRYDATVVSVHDTADAAALAAQALIRQGGYDRVEIEKSPHA